MKVQKLLIPVLVLALALVLILPACSPQTTPATSAPTTSAPTTSAPTTSAPKPSATTPASSAPATAKPAEIKAMNLIFWDYANLPAVKTAVERSAKAVLDASGGKITIKYEGGSLYGSGYDVSKTIRSKTVDMGYLAVAYHVKEFPIASLIEIPGITTRPESSTFAFWDMWKEFPEMAAEWDRANIQLVDMANAPPAIIMGKKPMNSIADLKGMQIRGNGWVGAALQQLGATVVSMSWGDIYPALERGTLDAVSSCHVEGAYTAGFQEVTKYSVDIGMGSFNTYGFAMNNDLWKSMTPQVQQIFKDNFKFGQVVLEEWSKLQTPAAAAFAKYGNNISKWSPDEIAKAQDIMRSKLLPQWKADLESAGYAKAFTSKVMDRYLALVTKYEKDAPYWYQDFFTKFVTK